MTYFAPHLRLNCAFAAIFIFSMASCRTTTPEAESTPKTEERKSNALEFAKKTECVPVPADFSLQPGVPTKPDANLTPGTLCKTGSITRYPEKILYCERDVNGSNKNEIYRTYKSANLLSSHFSAGSDFKVDHRIPLCAGGSNDSKNLWPQHISIFKFTDPLEPRICALMAEGKMKQSEAINIINGVKNDYKTAFDVCNKLNALLGI